MLKALAVLAGLVGLVVVARRWAEQPIAAPASASLGPHASFAGGHRYATEAERALDGGDADSLGEGLLMAIVDALRARGVGTNPVEPEPYGYMTVIEIDGDDVILQIGAGGEQDWLLFVKSPTGKVPQQVIDALASLDDVRDVTWRD